VLVKSSAESGLRSRNTLVSLTLCWVLLPVLLLTPALNLPVPKPLRSMDVYASMILVAFFALTRVPKSLVFTITPALVALSALTALMALLESVFGFGDTVGLVLATRSILTILTASAFGLFIWRAYGVEALEVVFRVFIACALLQGAVLWLSYVDSNFRVAMSALFFREDVAGAEHLVLLRVPGFVSTGGDGLSLNQALLCVVAIFGCYYVFPKGKTRSILIAALLAANVANAFTGRSGFYLGLVLAISVLVSFRAGEFKPGRILYLAPLFLLLGGIVYGLADRIGDYGASLRAEYGYEHPIARLFEGFIELEYYGGYRDDTVALLFSQVFLPQDAFRLAFGNNDFGQLPSNAIDSDVGYVRMVHGFGLVGLAAFLLGVFFAPLSRVRRLRRAALTESRPLLVAACDKRYRMVWSVLAVVLIFGLVSHFKIIYLSSRIYLFTFFLFLVLGCLSVVSNPSGQQARGAKRGAHV
jgi:hypothetical protein